MKTVINGFLVYSKYSWNDEAKIEFSTLDPRVHPSTAEYLVTAFIAEHSFEVETPDNFDPRPQQVAALEAEKQKVRAEFAARITEIERQISTLTCLDAA